VDFARRSQQGHFGDDERNVFGTLQVGYDRLIHDRILIGAFADYDSYPDSEDNFSQDTVKYKKTVGSLSGDFDPQGIWTVGGRLGFLVTPRILLYGLGGYSQLRLDGEVNADFNDPFWYKPGPALPSSVSLQMPDNLHGWTVGGGFETKLERRLSLKFEYRCSHFDGNSASVSGATYDEFSHYGRFSKTEVQRLIKENASMDLDDVDVQSVRVALVWKLTPDAIPVEPLK
jgi:outer membrane immunogenic protein